MKRIERNERDMMSDVIGTEMSENNMEKKVKCE